MRTLFAFVTITALALAGCGGSKTNNNGGVDAPGSGGAIDAPEVPIIDGSPDACVGLECMKVDCKGQGIGTTRLSGTVYAPNGTLPLYGVSVYVPNADPGSFTAGVTCDRCNDALPGSPTAKTTTDELGHFQLDDVPVAPNLPVIVTIGKWRRQLTVATVNQCADNPIDPAATRLPKNHTEGDMPQIAISTGGCDAMECLIHKLGIDDSEFTTSTGTGKVHLYAGTGGTNSFDSSFVNHGTFASSTTWWNDLKQLEKYDIVMFGCECSTNMDTKPAKALQAVYDYSNLGGRVFMSHYHFGWLQNAPQPWPMIANITDDGSVPDSGVDSINQTFDKGKALYTWLGGPEVKALDANHQLAITDPRDTAKSINNYPGTTMPRADDFVDLVSCSGDTCTTPSVQDLQFTTPNDKPESDRCGKVVFSDMHVASGSTSSTLDPFPTGCSTDPLSPQEKTLAFLFFDISSCVGPIVN